MKGKSNQKINLDRFFGFFIGLLSGVLLITLIGNFFPYIDDSSCRSSLSAWCRLYAWQTLFTGIGATAIGGISLYFLRETVLIQSKGARYPFLRETWTAIGLAQLAWKQMEQRRISLQFSIKSQDYADIQNVDLRRGVNISQNYDPFVHYRIERSWEIGEMILEKLKECKDYGNLEQYLLLYCSDLEICMREIEFNIIVPGIHIVESYGVKVYRGEDGYYRANFN